jgi:IS5 family transposase
MESDLDSLMTVIDNCEARVLHGEKVKMADKVLSVSDPDAGYIAKGQREAVIGYKPQLARSANGFIPALLVPRGNAADATQLVPLVDATIARTGVALTVVSVDDGYASRANVQALPERTIDVVSINGSKGRALTEDDNWDSPPYAYARDLRSAIESLMYTIKQSFNFGHVARRGIEHVHAELLEKVIAHNLCHIIRTRNNQLKLALAG